MRRASPITARVLVSRIGALPLHSLLLAIAFVVSAGFANEVPISAFARPLLLAITAAVGLTVILRLVTPSLQESSIWTSVLMVALLSLEPIRVSAGFLTVYVPPLAAIAIAGVAAYLAAAGLAMAVLRSRRSALGAARLNRVANQGAGILLVVVLLTAAIGALPRLGTSSLASPTPVACGSATRNELLPDIYHILLDGYPRSDVLEDRFHHQNDGFLFALEARGFDVARDNHSNYGTTGPTLASMFNMQYLHEIAGVAPLVGQPVRGRHELRRAVENAALFSYLRAQGYRIITTPSGWEHTATRGAADESLDHGEITDFERNLIDRTWIPELVSWFAADWYADQQRSRVLHAFEDVARVAKRPDAAPTFLYTHVPLPHLPIVFDESGPAPATTMRDYVPGEDFTSSDDQYGPAYSSQLQFLNGLVLQAVDAISASPRGRPAIVIIMSDHGYSHDGRSRDPHDRLSNLFAARTPARPQLTVPPPTPVNLYRRLAGAYLGACWPELPDRYFIAPDTDRQLMQQPIPNPDSHNAPDF